ncbi:MAG: type IV pilus assembly protein PilM [Candidatus Melainabacteria bacterium]|nr:type IV pilus assembly protein PilM [Candidatus Melainabacteria bacterium]
MFGTGKLFGFGIRKKKGPTFGIDINSDSITLIQLEKTRVGIEVTRFACMPTPANTVREGLIADPSAIGFVISDLMLQAGIAPTGPSPTINMTIPAQAVVIRLMPVPTGMPPDELAEVVTQEATNHVPFPISDANLDWSLMPATERTDADGVRRVDVILAAVQRSIVETCWRTTDSCGAHLGKIEVSSLAAIRGLATAGYLDTVGQMSMVVNVRQDATDINVIRSAMPLFGRSVIIGMETLTEAISRSLEIDFETALTLLPEIPLFGMPPKDQRMGQAAQVARTIFSDITDELERSLEFYQSQVGDVKLDQIILTGPGCMVPNLDQYIGSRMGYRTIFGDAMRDMTFDQSLVVERMRPILASSLGSSLDPIWNPAFTVDLDLNKEGRLPLFYDERATQKIEAERPVGPYWFRPALAGGLVALALAGSALAYLNYVEIPTKQAQLVETEAKIVQARKDLEQVNQLKETNTSLRMRQKVLNYLVSKGRRWSSYMDTIQSNTPKGVQIDHVIFGQQDFQVEGLAEDFTAVSKLSLNLEGSPLIKESSIDFAGRKDKIPQYVTFGLTAKIKPVDLPRAVGPSSTAPSVTPSIGSVFTENGKTSVAKRATPELDGIQLSTREQAE